MNNIEHTYSFTAVFEDGTVIEAIHTDPKGHDCLTRNDGSGSRFTDVQAKEEESKLIGFVIHNEEKSLGVDLRDGHFELNSIPFWQHRPDRDSYKDFRIIYYRTVQRTMSQASGQELSGEATGYTVGWQVTKNGENIQRTVTI